jgi:hypothetical protein
MFNKNNPLCIGLYGGLGLVRSDQQNLAVSRELVAI